MNLEDHIRQLPRPAPSPELDQRIARLGQEHGDSVLQRAVPAWLALLLLVAGLMGGYWWGGQRATPEVPPHHFILVATQPRPFDFTTRPEAFLPDSLTPEPLSYE